MTPMIELTIGCPLAIIWGATGVRIAAVTLQLYILVKRDLKDPDYLKINDFELFYFTYLSGPVLGPLFLVVYLGLKHKLSRAYSFDINLDALKSKDLEVVDIGYYRIRNTKLIAYKAYRCGNLILLKGKNIIFSLEKFEIVAEEFPKTMIKHTK